MRVVTKQALIATAAERFREAHQRLEDWLPTVEGADSATIYKQLRALPEKSGEKAIVDAVGDNRWTENLCDECGADSDVIVLLGEEIHHPTDFTAVCLACLSKAKKLAGAS